MSWLTFDVESSKVAIIGLQTHFSKISGQIEVNFHMVQNYSHSPRTKRVIQVDLIKFVQMNFKVNVLTQR